MKRETVLTAVGVAVIALMLGIAFQAYLHPDFVLNLGGLLFFCS